MSRGTSRGVIHRAAQKCLHTDRAADRDRFEIEALLRQNPLTWATLNGSSAMELPVVENLTFLGCADTEMALLNKKRSMKMANDPHRIPTHWDIEEIPVTTTNRDSSANETRKLQNRTRRQA